MSMLDTPVVIRDLTVDERIALAQEIWDSILVEECGGELELSDAEMRDMDRRLDKYRANRGNLKSWGRSQGKAAVERVTYPIDIEEEAETEIAEACSWYEARRRGLGREFRLAVEDALDVLSRYPRMYPIAYRELRRARIKDFPYSIHYLFEDGRVVVLSVIHHSRNPRWL